MNITRKLGPMPIAVSAIGLGGWAIGGPFTLFGLPDGWGEIDDNAAVRAVQAGIAHGVTLFDTADVYGTGHSERILGRALGDRRDRVTIATKFGYTYDEATREVAGTDVTPAYIDRAVAASLKRLQTDWIDLYQIHVGDLAPDAIAAAAEKLEALAERGTIRCWGWSTDSAERVAALGDYPHFAAVQQQLNLLEGNTDLLDLVEKRGLASLNRSPLAMGLLTGKFTADSRLPRDDVRGAGHSWVALFHDGRPDPAALARLDAIRELLRTGGRSLAQGALSWLLARSPCTIPIPGFKSEAQAIENAAAMAFGPLPEPVASEIDRLLAAN